jgi:hypothetical protein
MLPQYYVNNNDVVLLIASTIKVSLARLSTDPPPPDDGLHGQKHVGVTVKECFNVNFNILFVK